MLHTDVYASLLAQGKQSGADFVEIYVERWRRRALRTVNAKVAEATSGIQLGAGIRLFFGTDVVYGYTNDLSEAALSELLTSLAQLKGGSDGRPDSRGRGGIAWRRARPGLAIPAPAFASSALARAWGLARPGRWDAGAGFAPRKGRGKGSWLDGGRRHGWPT